MEAGDLPLADRLLERAQALGEQLGQPIIDWYYALTRAKRESISGSSAEAEKLARDAFEVGHRVSQPDARLWLAIQLFVTRLLQGTLTSEQNEPLEPGPFAALDSAGEAAPNRSVPLLVEALQIATACELGRSDDARARFDVLMRDELRDLPYDWTALAIPAVASVACAHLGDLPRARTLYAMLQPYAGQFVDSGPGWFGTTSHHLANLALMLGRPRQADAHFADATDAYTRLRANTWLMRAQLDRARMLLEHGNVRDTTHADKLLDDVLRMAEETGLPAVMRTAASLPARRDRRLTRS